MINAWKKKKGGFDDRCDPTVNLYYPAGTGGNVEGGSPDVTGHATVAATVVSIEFRAQLLLVDSPLPTFF